MTRLFVALGIAGALFSTPAEAAPPSPATREICPRALATRRASDVCWLAYRDAATGDEACLTRELANRELATGGPRCAVYGGHWKATRLPEAAGGAPGEDRRRFVAAHRAAEALSARPSTLSRVLATALAPIERFRERISRALAEDGADPTGLLRHLLLNESSTSPAPSLLRLVGFVHLLTATGIHLYALASAISSAIGVIGAWSGGLGLSLRAATRLRRAGVAGAWTFAWLLCGARPGMLRPLVLVALRTLAREAGFRWRRWFPLGFSLALSALWREPSDAGHWIYALAVGGGMMAVPDRAAHTRPRGASEAALDHLRLAFGSWLPVAAVEAARDGLVSIATPWLSLVTLPLFAQLLFPATLLAVATDHLEWLTTLSRFASATLDWLGQGVFAWSSVWLVTRAQLLLGAGLGLVPVTLARARPRARGDSDQAPRPARVPAFVPLFALLLAWPAHREAPGPTARAASPASPAPATVTQLDIGQGDGALIMTTVGRAGLLDTGSARVLHEAQWIRLLARAHVRELDWVALTHLDEDHSGALAALARVAPVACVVASRAELEGPRGTELRARAAEGRFRLADWSAGCVPYPVSDPDRRETAAAESHGHRSANAHMGGMLVPLVTGGAYLSLGDAEGGDELRMLRDLEPALSRVSGARRILKVSHHGSLTSSDPDFLTRFQPTEAWISAGRGNPYAHPRPEVLARLADFGIPVRRTDQVGSLSSAEPAPTLKPAH